MVPHAALRLNRVNPERDILVDLFNAAGGHNWKRNAGWGA
jgi:hypothetical protein